MVDAKYFLDKINKLDESIKHTIEEVTNTNFIIHVNDIKTIGAKVNELLEKI